MKRVRVKNLGNESSPTNLPAKSKDFTQILKSIGIDFPSTGGRPSKYNNEVFPDIAYMLCACLGATNQMLADCFGITPELLRTWYVKYENFFAMVLKGRDFWDNQRVQKCLRDRATGYTYEEEEWQMRREVIKTIGKKKIYGKPQLVKTKVLRKHQPADIGAIKLWLLNRWPERYAEKYKVESHHTETREEVLRLEVDMVKNLPKEEQEQLVTILSKLPDGSYGPEEKISSK